MSIFAGTVPGTFDARKGRISVPVAFRTVLARLGAEDIVLRKSDHGPCVDVWPATAFQEEVTRRLGDLDPFEADYAAKAERLAGEVTILHPDAEGRLVLPRDLAEYAGLGGEIVFTGRVKFFQIWAAAALARAGSARQGASA